jgi:hypothetical protein
VLVLSSTPKEERGTAYQKSIEERKVVHGGRVNVDTGKHPIFDYTTLDA